MKKKTRLGFETGTTSRRELAEEYGKIYKMIEELKGSKKSVNYKSAEYESILQRIELLKPKMMGFYEESEEFARKQFATNMRKLVIIDEVGCRAGEGLNKAEKLMPERAAKCRKEFQEIEDQQLQISKGLEKAKGLIISDETSENKNK